MSKKFEKLAWTSNLLLQFHTVSTKQYETARAVLQKGTFWTVPSALQILDLQTVASANLLCAVFSFFISNNSFCRI